MLKDIPKMRILFFLITLGMLPVLLSFMLVSSSLNAVKDLRAGLNEICEMACLNDKKQAINMAVRNHFRESDHFYIDKNLETLTFLEPEIEGLQKLLTNKSLADDEAIRKRLELLTGPGNALSFSEGVVQTAPLFQETVETLVHPVEINGNDLQKILAKVESVTMGSFTPGPNPLQLIILDFKLDRKAISEKNEVFILNLKLLKREFL